MLAIDTETTGVDAWHGCRPFFISLCYRIAPEQYMADFFEWDVDPTCRRVLPPKGDRQRLQALIDKHEKYILHNAKFDIRMLAMMGIKLQWSKIEDTLVASHVMHSNESHGLKDLAFKYLDIPDDDQQELQKATNEARRVARKHGWDIARDNHPHWPALKLKEGLEGWKQDTWLPRTVARLDGYKQDPKCRFPEPCKCHPWWHVLAKYAIQDAERTMLLWLMYDAALAELTHPPVIPGRKPAQPSPHSSRSSSPAGTGEPFPMRRLYDIRRKQLEITYAMENRGCSVHLPTLNKLHDEFTAKRDNALAECTKIVSTLPIWKVLAAPPPPPSARSKPKPPKQFNPRSHPQLVSVMFSKQGLGLKATKFGKPHQKTGVAAPSTKKEIVLELLDDVPPDSKAFRFIQNLIIFRKGEKHVEYATEYQLAGLKPG